MDITDQIRHAPKVVLHDHLDGGLRPVTIVELADQAGLALPVDDAAELGQWFFDQADSGSLAQYLTTFDLTVAVMRSYDNLRRVASEFVLDQADDGVVYAEARWAPAQHVTDGLSLEDGVRAVRDGLRDGMAEVAATGRTIIARQLLCELRGLEPTLDVAELAIAYRDDSVAGLDCAGPEIGHSSASFLPSYQLAASADMFITIHAGEAAGLESIAEAIHICGANRIGHGVALIDDIHRDGDRLRLGHLASYIAALRLPLEIAPSSNLQTGVVSDLRRHPFRELDRAGVRLTVNADNRLMSRTTVTREFQLLVDAFGYGMADVRRFTLNAAKSAFLSHEERLALIHDLVLPGYDPD
ncbi:MAG: adenosine deaminase [Propionibacteriaceae bacterium]|jgi:adenosine deaminase|nr:adenosine deaminase [Propionibacteriaceae bacterium]